MPNIQRKTKDAATPPTADLGALYQTLLGQIGNPAGSGHAESGPGGVPIGGEHRGGAELIANRGRPRRWDSHDGRDRRHLQSRPRADKGRMLFMKNFVQPGDTITVIAPSNVRWPTPW